MNVEKLDIWKRAVKLSAEIYKTTSEVNNYAFRSQLTRSGTFSAKQYC
ncbi:hypothetical protein [Pseudoalteromonas sp. OFAV1]